MKKIIGITLGVVVCLLFSCSDDDKLEEKGFSVGTASANEEDDPARGIAGDSNTLETRPGSVLLTGSPRYRLVPVYKVNYHKEDKTTFIGSNRFHSSHSSYADMDGNDWNYNYMPGIDAVYGYNMVNISHYDAEADTAKSFFPEPVLVRTLYFPAYTKDTLNFEPVSRNYYMVSVYDEDTNKDGFINLRDLRRFYVFDIKAENKKALVPADYSVLSSQFDPANDRMYVYAQLDENGNGSRDEGEDTRIFWIDLKDPKNTGRQY